MISTENMFEILVGTQQATQGFCEFESPNLIRSESIRSEPFRSDPCELIRSEPSELGAVGGGAESPTVRDFIRSEPSASLRYCRRAYESYISGLFQKYFGPFCGCISLYEQSNN